MDSKGEMMFWLVDRDSRSIEWLSHPTAKPRELSFCATAGVKCGLPVAPKGCERVRLTPDRPSTVRWTSCTATPLYVLSDAGTVTSLSPRCAFHFLLIPQNVALYSRLPVYFIFHVTLTVLKISQYHPKVLFSHRIRLQIAIYLLIEATICVIDVQNM
jgi:hypothetical protein